MKPVEVLISEQKRNIAAILSTRIKRGVSEMATSSERRRLGEKKREITKIKEEEEKTKRKICSEAIIRNLSLNSCLEEP